MTHVAPKVVARQAFADSGTGRRVDTVLLTCIANIFGNEVDSKQYDRNLQTNLILIARALLLLRAYESQFEMPSQGASKDQEFILREINKDLYAGGTPIWVLAKAMVKAAEGLTGKRGVNFWLLPRKTLIFAPTSGATSMFSTTRGFNLYKLDRMEPVVIRLNSYASYSIWDRPPRLPHPEEFRKAELAASSSFYLDGTLTMEREQLAAEILDTVSKADNWFSFLNMKEDSSDFDGVPDPPDAFWEVAASTRELFYRLVAVEAIESINKVDALPMITYPFPVIAFFRMAAAAGACAIWFDGSWYDIAASSILAFLVGLIGSSSVIKFHDRIILEVVASLMVGLISGLVALQWPDYTCFGAMALAGVLDIFHGFRIVYAIMEIMSRHTIAGGADLLEGILFTALIAYFLEFGHYLAAAMMGDSSAVAETLTCEHAIDERWYLVFVPLAAISWSGLFRPSQTMDLLLMGLHGVLGFAVSWAISRSNSMPGNLNNFMAAMSVTLSAGFVSRMTGRQAIGNTVAGIFGLVPGAYLVREIFSDDSTDFLASTIKRCVVIGIGAWTGTLLHSPTVLGTKYVLFSGSSQSRNSGTQGRSAVKKSSSMLFF